MALVVGIDTFASLQDASDYLALYLPDGDPVWDAYSETKREVLLRKSSRRLSSLISWLGFAVSPDQPLAFPRYDLYTAQGAEISRSGIPAEIKHATVEDARRIAVRDYDKDSALVDLDIRGSGQDFFGGGQIRRRIPSAVWDLIPTEWYRSGGSLRRHYT